MTSKKSIADKRSQAQSLYIKGVLQKDIAEIIGISEQTISKWRKSFNWDEILEQTNITRPSLLRDAYIQLAAVNNKIKENGNVPKKELSDAKAQLLREIELFSEQPIYKYIEVFEEFTAWLSKNNPKIMINFANLSMQFIEDLRKKNT
jgi:transposase